MQLTEKQLQVQEAIIKAVHGTDDIEEARAKERRLVGCLLHSHDGIWEYKNKKMMIHKETRACMAVGFFTTEDIVIGLPPTLERVLITIEGKEGIDHANYGGKASILEVYGDTATLTKRKLLKEDGTPASLRDQSEETQERIASIILG